MIAEGCSRLVLGTVQLGMDYGIANSSGCPNEAVALEIVRAAWQGGVREFDTAQGYGESEAVLGRVFAKLGISADVSVVTKPDKVLDYFDEQAVFASLRGSCDRLGARRLGAVLLHSESFLDSWDDLIRDKFESLRVQGIVERVGISVYSPESALLALRTPGIDVVQIPYNALDRRFENAGVFDEAKQQGKVLYLRSIYLQGLLLMNPNRLPANVVHAKAVLAEFQAFAVKLGLTPLSLALAFVRDAHPGSKVIFGAETPEQVAESLRLWSVEVPSDLVETVQTRFGDVSENVLNPSSW